MTVKILSELLVCLTT